MKRPLNLWLIGLLAICLISLWLGGRSLRREEAPPVEPVDAVEGLVQAEPRAVQLLVLNGTTESGLARDYGALLPRLGCVTAGIGNAPSIGWPRSVLVNRRLTPDQAAELARELGGLPIIREWDRRTTEDAVLVLGDDHARIAEAIADRTSAGTATAGK